jgi:lipopolysaccharide export system permease protein
MLFSRILSRYLLREVLEYTGIGFLAFSTILVTQNLLRRLDDLVAVGFRTDDLIAVLGCLLAMLTAYAVPIAFLFGILLAMGRLSADSEITAMRACGLGMRHLVVPVLLLGVAVSALTAVLMIRTEPKARLALRTVLQNVAARGAILEPGKFRTIGSRVVYVEGRDRENNLTGVLVADRTNSERPFVVFAESGRFTLDSEHSEIRLELQRGDIHLEDGGGADARHRRIGFDELSYVIDAKALLDVEGYETRPPEMSTRRLRRILRRVAAGESLDDLRERDPVLYELQIHRRFALPFAPLLFALVGVPLGLRRSRGGRSWGALLCVTIVFAYYALLSVAEFLVEQGGVPPALALWLPNVLFALGAIPLLRRASRGES